jgi:hypothetical protein
MDVFVNEGTAPKIAGHRAIGYHGTIVKQHEGSPAYFYVKRSQADGIGSTRVEYGNHIFLPPRSGIGIPRGAAKKSVSEKRMENMMKQEIKMQEKKTVNFRKLKRN